METIVLTRTGRPPLEIKGKKLYEGHSGKIAGKGKLERWFELSLYEAEDNSYLARIAFCSTWTREAPGHTEVRLFASLGLLFEALAAYDPCQYCVLHPERHEQEKIVNGPKNEMARRAITQLFQRLLQGAIDATQYKVPMPSGSQDNVLLEVWIPRELRDLLEQKRGPLSVSEIVLETLRNWVQDPKNS
jgi:hypothetical protein